MFLIKNIKSDHRTKRDTSSYDCDLKIQIQAFEKNYTLCLFSKDLKDEDIIKDKYDTINVTVFKEDNRTMEIPLNTMELEHVEGYILNEPFSSANGYLIKHHFYGLVNIEVNFDEDIQLEIEYIKDHMHFIEPSMKMSNDLHIYKNGKAHLMSSLIHNKVLQTEKYRNKIFTDFQSLESPCKGKCCEVTLVADHLFYEDVGLNSLQYTIMIMLWHVKEANRYS